MRQKNFFTLNEKANFTSLEFFLEDFVFFDKDTNIFEVGDLLNICSYCFFFKNPDTHCEKSKECIFSSELYEDSEENE